jgi:transketolase
MPCQEWFRAQDAAYRQQVLPTEVPIRVSVEAGIAMPWRDLVGDQGASVSLEHFGASAPYQVLYEQFGFTADAVVATVHAALSRAGIIKGSTTGN